MSTIYADDELRIIKDGSAYRCELRKVVDFGGGRKEEYWDPRWVWGADDALEKCGWLGTRAYKAIKQYEQRLRDERFGERLRKAQPCFIRFGQIPESGRSWDYRDGRPEPGVAAYAGWKDEEGYIIDLRGVDQASYLFISASEPYEVEGEVNGRCSDGAPTLMNARIVRPIREKIEIMA